MALNELQKQELRTLCIGKDGPSVEINTDGGYNPVFQYTPDGAVLITVGGRGLQIAQAIKELLYQRAGSIDPTKVAFVCFDSSKDDIEMFTSGEEEYKLKPSEVHNINNCQAVSAMLSGTTPPPHINSIMPENLPVSQLLRYLNTDGASQNRLAGYLYGVDSASMNTIRNALHNAQSKFTSNPVVHVIGGSAGGTASGFVLPISYLARTYFPNSTFYGHIMLADSYSEFDDPSKCDNLKANCGGFVKELDYFLSAVDNSNPCIFNFGTSTVVCTESIYNVCTIYGGSTNEGGGISSRTAASNKACSEFVLNLLSNATVTDNGVPVQLTTSINGNAIQNGAQNLTNLSVNPNVPKDRVLAYLVVGADVKALPVKEIASLVIGTTLSGAKKIMESNRRNLGETESKDFLDGCLVNPKTVAEQLKTAARPKFAGFTDKVDKKALKKGLVSVAEQNADQICTGVQKVAAAEMATYQNNATVTFKAECDGIFEDIAKGPLYLKDLLKGATRAGINITSFKSALEGFGAVCTTVIKDLNDDLLREQTNMANARSNKDVQSYKNAFEAYFSTKYAKELLEAFSKRDMFKLETATSAVFKLNELMDKYVALAETIEEIDDILARDQDAAKKAFTQNGGNTNIFAIETPSVKLLRQNVYNSLVTEYSAHSKHVALYRELTASMKGNPDSWLEIETTGGKSNAKTARKFFKNAFSNRNNVGDALGKTLYDFMSGAYAGQTPHAYDTLVRDIYDALRVGSRKMLSIDPAFDVCAKEATAVRPAPSLDWQTAFNNAEGGFKSATSDDANTMSMLQILYSVPLMAWTELWNCKQSYEAACEDGRAGILHTDGSKEADWVNRQSPYSENATLVAGRVDKKHKAIMADMTKLFDKALDIGAVFRDENNGTYYANLIQKGLFTEDDKGNITLDAKLMTAVQDYCDATDANGNVRVNFDQHKAEFIKGKSLFNAVILPFLDASIPDKQYALSHYANMVAVNKEDAVTIFRCRHNINRATKYAIAVYEAVCKVLDEYSKMIVKTAKYAQFTKLYRNEFVRMADEQDDKGTNRRVFQYKNKNGEWVTYWRPFHELKAESSKATPDQFTLHTLQNLPTYLACERFYSMPEAASIVAEMLDELFNIGEKVRQGGNVDSYNATAVAALLANAKKDLAGNTEKDYIAAFYAAMAAYNPN